MISPRWKKVLRDLWDNKSRTVLSVLSIAVGIIAFGGMLIARETILDNLNTAYQQSNPADVTIDMNAFDHELIRWVQAQPGVQEAAGLTTLNGTLIKPDGSEQDITLHAHADYDAIDLNQLTLVSGGMPQQRGDIAIERGSGGGVNYAAGEMLRISIREALAYA